ncbi:MAG: tripartite tricarboxylate transporter substrate binding protein [Alphaproteobacteria bacterium]|nr:tripartite tricarboxylate transporter substrate binding protein [Alphaproteobacteria bacterium]
MRLDRRGVLAGMAALPLAARAQDKYPSKPLTLVVPFDAGGGTDQVGRAFAEALKAQLGQPIAVQNIGGAGGAVGLTRLSGMAADGYTLGMGGGFLVSASLRGALKLPANEFSHLARLSQEAFVLGVPAASPLKTMQDFLAAARAKPEAVSIGTAGAGALTHLAAQALGDAAKAKLNIVHFAGGAKLLTAVLGAHADAGVFSQVEVLPQLNQPNGVRVLATFTRAPSAKLPGVPTLASLGLGGVPEGPWQGVLAPKGLPGPVRAVLAGAVAKAQSDPQWLAFLDKNGLAPSPLTGAAYDTFLEDEVKTIGALLKAVGLSQ